MSWIIARRKNGIYETYNDADIYGRGHFGGKSIFDLPVLYPDANEAINHLRGIEKEDGWQYEVNFYDR